MLFHSCERRVQKANANAAQRIERAPVDDSFGIRRAAVRANGTGVAVIYR
jgi:hypothetical protein